MAEGSSAGAAGESRIAVASWRVRHSTDTMSRRHDGQPIHFTPTSLDGSIADETGPRSVGETMAVWATPDMIPGLTPALLDFAQIGLAAANRWTPALHRAIRPARRLALRRKR